MNGSSRNIAQRSLSGRVELVASTFFGLSLAFLLLVAFPAVSQADASSTWTVAVPVANVRAEPHGSSELVTQLSAGDQVAEIQRQGVWLQIRLPDERLAWMHQVTLSQSIQLFGLALPEAERAAMRTAISEAGVRVVREVDSYPYDLYDPSPWMAGATEMAVGYTLDEELFAVAEITFRSFNDTEQVRQIAEQVRDQLGPWQRVMGRRAEGPVEFEWQRGGVQVLVHRGWPDTTTYLTYEMPDRMEQMQQALQNR
ncbi:SH3 domain-containing protein [Marinospirillum celere]|uniref:SH3 domain-containing protein n=1 Tax=Marinospirillum celere TaxID=1122252 RepID=A0A1I1JTD1_9GAMM|nr:SH3 domain-containing protein [Marinospirillum celere]SFC49778.1 SH3 domain-containing protein [Marinospirillum celere]